MSSIYYTLILLKRVNLMKDIVHVKEYTIYMVKAHHIKFSQHNQRVCN